jgi:four helix bundle protein
MSGIKNFWDLETWQLAHDCTKAVYSVTASFPKEERYGLVGQLRRALSSVGANIAESFDRCHINDKVRFYHIARGSLSEVMNFIILVKDLSYIDNHSAKELFTKTI